MSKHVGQDARMHWKGQVQGPYRTSTKLLAGQLLQPNTCNALASDIACVLRHAALSHALEAGSLALSLAITAR
jgi:hypothetical protein